MAELTIKKKISSSIIPDWTKLPEELLDVIFSKKLNNCFDVIHARSVCSSWRSSIPFPSSLDRQSYSLPTFPIEKVGLWNLEKIPLFLCSFTWVDKVGLFNVKGATSEFFVGGVGKDDTVDYIDRPSPLQCLLKIQTSNPTLRNMLDFHIVPLGHEYRMSCWNPEGQRIAKRVVAFLPLSSDRGGEEFVVLCSYGKQLLVFKSAERKWVWLENVPDSECTALLTFRGRFYATFSNTFSNGDVFVTDPYSLKANRMIPPMLRTHVVIYLVQSGNDELFMVEKSNLIANELKFRVSKLDVETGRWVAVRDLGDRVLVIGYSLNVCFLAKELPDGCGVTGNSILFTGEPSCLSGNKPCSVPPCFYKCGKNCWKQATSENLVTILDTYPFLSFKVEC